MPKHSPSTAEEVDALTAFMATYRGRTSKSGLWRKCKIRWSHASIPGILCLTGAGISTESGIPDYRSEDVGLYATSNHKPTQFQVEPERNLCNLEREGVEPFARMTGLCQVPGVSESVLGAKFHRLASKFRSSTKRGASGAQKMARRRRHWTYCHTGKNKNIFIEKQSFPTLPSVSECWWPPYKGW